MDPDEFVVRSVDGVWIRQRVWPVLHGSFVSTLVAALAGVAGSTAKTMIEYDSYSESVPVVCGFSSGVASLGLIYGLRLCAAYAANVPSYMDCRLISYASTNEEGLRRFFSMLPEGTSASARLVSRALEIPYRFFSSNGELAEVREGVVREDNNGEVLSADVIVVAEGGGRATSGDGVVPRAAEAGSDENEAHVAAGVGFVDNAVDSGLRLG